MLSCLLDRSDIAFLDALDHACIIDGCRLGFGRSHKFRHNDPDDLEKKLANAPADRGKIIVVDGVFSMDGDIAPLAEIVELAEKHDAMVHVDECHATGFVGTNGRGTPEHCGVEGRIDIITSTLGKALGGASGGFTAARREIVGACALLAATVLCGVSCFRVAAWCFALRCGLSPVAPEEPSVVAAHPVSLATCALLGPLGPSAALNLVIVPIGCVFVSYTLAQQLLVLAGVDPYDMIDRAADPNVRDALLADPTGLHKNKSLDRALHRMLRRD